MKYKDIRLDSIRADRPVRLAPAREDDLFVSVRRNGLHVPLLVNPENFRLISGYRRYEAIVKAGSRTSVRVGLPADLLEGCEEVRSHLDEQNIRSVPLTVRERINLAVLLAELPRPADAPARSFSSDTHVGPAVGLTSTILRRLRSTVRKAREGETDVDDEAVAARRTLALMLEAVERPPDGWTRRQAVRHLHDALGAGDFPRSLADLPQRAAGRRPGSPTVPPRRGFERAAVSKRTSGPEVRRALDAIAGACAGLASLDTAGLAPDEVAHTKHEINNTVQVLRQVVRGLPGGERTGKQ
ncbi:ParB/Srx family N-terminal domain-containing protein [Kitasatospora sp. NPDC089797]|uniref:ParB/Srx family N-terminal domain-containing protein n=1 Tax=Kitasatospora sp. NPDC089797 TaxID=3155298 RepID=UPI00341F65A6